MSNEDEQNPLTRPRFIFAAIGVLALVVIAVIVGINIATQDDPDAPAPTPITSTPPADPEPSGDAASVCGLSGTKLTGTIATAPEAEWEYQGTVAYPTSKTFGPGKTDDLGVRYCFQHSPEGALFMAANSLAQASDPAVVSDWSKVALSEGQYRETLLSDVGATSNDSSGLRLEITGFRLLTYDGNSARVDVGIRGSGQGQSITASAVYNLIWQAGDWKLNADVAAPFDFATIPDLAGYVPWRP